MSGFAIATPAPVAAGGSGNVVGPASSTTNAIASFSDTTGEALKDCAATVDAAGNIAATTITAGGASIPDIDINDPVTGAFNALSGHEHGLRIANESNNGNVLLSLQGVTVDRTVTFPNASGTITLGGNTFTGTGSVVRATAPTVTTLGLGGGLVFLGLTSSALPASTTEYPADKNCGIHKDTNTGNVHFAYNDGGVIKSVQLS